MRFGGLPLPFLCKEHGLLTLDSAHPLKHTHIFIFFCTMDKPHAKPVTDTQIVNLSARKLSNTEINLLDKGLKCIPTPRHSNTQ